MIRSPAGYGGEDRIKRYLDYYQPSYGAMMLAEGLFGFSTPAGVLLGDETSGMAIDFTSAPTSTLVRTANSLSTNYYSGLPFQNEGNGPITFSRTSNATVTDADGKIKWAGHNLLTNSESFDASAWTKSSATVTANSEAAPNGTTTGDTVAASGANGTALQSYTALAVPYTFGVWLKRKTGTGTIEIAADNGTYTAVTITSSWALYTVTQTPAAGSKSAGIRIVTSGDEVYAWGAHLYRSDLGGMVLNPARGDAYYPTTPRNLLGFTESLTTGWTNTNTTDSIVTETNPNGLASSVEVTATAGNGTLLGSLSLLASPYTFSIWLKRKTGTGVVEITVDGTTYVAAAVTGTWTRFSTTLTPTAGTKTPGIRLVTSGDAVFAWGAQLSDSASLDAYSPVYGAAVTSAAYYAPRLDYDPVTLAANGLLVEEQRTNLLLNSATLSTQNATVTAVAHTLSFYGTGTVTLSGASTAGPLVGTGAYPNRVTLTFTPTAGTLTLTVTGSVTQAQLEAGSFATSYIPTGASTATRTADVASVSTQAFPYSATEGTLVVSGSFSSLTAAGIYGLASLSTGSSGNSVNLFGAPPNMNANVYAASVQTASYSVGTLTNPIKAAIAYKLNDVNAAVNGVAQTTDTTAGMPTGIDRLEIGRFWGNQTANGWIRQITYLPRRISNAELQSRTA